MRLAIITLCCLLAYPALAKPRGTSFIYIRGANTSTLMAGDYDDVARVRKALKPGERALWARAADGKEYIIRDAATLDELDRIWKTATELAEQLGKLGEEQGKYGEQLGKIGEQQGKLGLHQARLGLKLANATDAEHAAIEREMRDIDDKMRDLNKQMQTFEKPMRKLDKQMQELQPKHDAASKQAEAGTSALLSRAISSGIAKPF